MFRARRHAPLALPTSSRHPVPLLLALLLVLSTLGTELVFAQSDPGNTGQAQDTPAEPQPGEPPTLATEEPQLGEPPVMPTEAPAKETVPPDPKATVTPTEDPGWTVVTPEPTGAAGLTPVELGTGIAISKYACPASVTRDAPTDVLAASCVPWAPGARPSVTFTLTDGSGSRTAETGETIFAGWESVAPGPFTIAETIPAGYGEPRVFCAASDGTGDHELAVSAGAVTGTYAASSSLLCAWFNFEQGAPVRRVSVEKIQCPAGVNSEGALAEFRAACTNAHDGVTFSLADGNPANPETQVTTAGHVEWSDVIVPASGALALTETLPAGFVKPAVFCGEGELLPQHLVDGATGPMLEIAGLTSVERFDYRCEWYNIPESPGFGIRITKWVCDPGTEYGHVTDGASYYASQCRPYTADDIAFTLTLESGGTSRATLSGGEVLWTGVPAGMFTIQEDLPPTFGVPIVNCSEGSFSGYPALPTGFMRDWFTAASGGVLHCDWYNMPGGRGSLTIYKYTCPPGYNVDRAGAIPETECAALTDGIAFELMDSESGPVDFTRTTGTDGPGTVIFDNLLPARYLLTEVVPAGTAEVFVLDCFGIRTGSVHPVPLVRGNSLDFILGADSDVACYWYNVPEPEDGGLTVIKYACSTRTFVSEVDCEIHEHGQAFDLLQWNATRSAWTTIDTATTDGFGEITWTSLPAAKYWLDEPGTDWCHIASTRLEPDGDIPFFTVVDGEETVVKVYNCGIPTTTTTPDKYPNTGVPSAGSDPMGPRIDGSVIARQPGARKARRLRAPTRGRRPHPHPALQAGVSDPW